VVGHGFQHYRGSKVLLSLSGESGFLSFPDGGWERNKEDALKLRLPNDSPSEEPSESLVGLDFTWGTMIDRNSSFLTRKSTSFDLVEDFHLRGVKRLVSWSRGVRLSRSNRLDFLILPKGVSSVWLTTNHISPTTLTRTKAVQELSCFFLTRTSRTI
jgi:hypothetical protein